jgi:hypothetical protein
MFRFALGTDGKIGVNPSERLVDRLRERHIESARLITSILELTGLEYTSSKVELMARHPFAAGLGSFQKGLLSPEHGKALLTGLMELDEHQLARLKRNELSVQQNQCLMPDLDTRGAAIRIDTEQTAPLDCLDHLVRPLYAALGDEWHDSLLVNTVSFVKVPGMPELPHFSGSTNDIWAAMHMTFTSDIFVLAEALTHESSHFWVHLLEELSPLAREAWENEIWVSAWRGDPRPIGGVLHGIHVFSCVSVVLASLCKSGLAGDAIHEKLERLAYVIAQVEDGLYEAQRSNVLLEAGTEICRWAEERIAPPRDLLSPAVLTNAREKVSSRRKGKIQRWREQGLAVV